MRDHIRWMIRRDLPEVLAAEEATLDAWTEDDILTCLRQRTCIGMTVERGEAVIGHMIYELHDHHLEVLRMVVHPRYQRQGVGSLMLAKLRSKLSSHRRSHLVIIVPERNVPMQLFLRSQQFLCEHVSRDYFDSQDGFEFVWHVPEQLVPRQEMELPF